MKYKKKHGFISIEIIIIGCIVIAAGFYAVSSGEKKSISTINSLSNAVNKVKEEQDGRIFINDDPLSNQWYTGKFYINGYPAEPGLYDDNGNLIEKWANTGIDLSIEYGDVINGAKQATYILNNKYPNATIVVIPDGQEKINQNAFRSTINIKLIAMPKSIKSINNRAFTYALSLQQIVVDPNNKYFTSINGVLYDKNVTELLYYPYNGNRDSYTIPKTVKNIYQYCFAQIRIKDISVESGNSFLIMNNGNLYSSDKKTLYYYVDKTGQTIFTIPEGVINIHSYAFTSTTSLKKIICPASLRNVGVGIIESSSVEEVDLKEGISVISAWSLNGYKLKSINIPSTVNIIEQYAFAYTALTSVNFVNTNGWKTNGSSVNFSDPNQAATYIKNNQGLIYIRS